MLQSPPAPPPETSAAEWILSERHRQIMSMHRSLRTAKASGAKRNVLKRFERVALLQKRGQWKAGDRVVGLRKTKPES